MAKKSLRNGCLASIVSASLLFGTGVLAEKHLGVSERARDLYAARQEMTPGRVQDGLSVLPDSTAYRLMLRRGYEMPRQMRYVLGQQLIR